MADELANDFSLVVKAPFYDDSVLKASENSLFGETGRNDLISHLILLLLLLNI